MSATFADIDIETRKAIVGAWLVQNIEYARAHVKLAVNDRNGDKVREWETWRSFSEHALGEVQSGLLDMWIANFENSKFDPTLVDEAESSFGDV